MNRCHVTLKPCTILRYTQPTNPEYQSRMLKLATDTATVVSTWTTCQKNARYGGFLSASNSRLDALDAWTLTLSETAHTTPSNKTSHTRVLYRPRSGMWQRGQNQIFHPGCFSTQKACCGLFNRVEKCTFENRKVFHLPVFMVEVQEYPMIQPYGASCG